MQQQQFYESSIFDLLNDTPARDGSSKQMYEPLSAEIFFWLATSTSAVFNFNTDSQT